MRRCISTSHVRKLISSLLCHCTQGTTRAGVPSVYECANQIKQPPCFAIKCEAISTNSTLSKTRIMGILQHPVDDGKLSLWVCLSLQVPCFITPYVSNRAQLQKFSAISDPNLTTDSSTISGWDRPASAVRHRPSYVSHKFESFAVVLKPTFPCSQV